jgi:quercetin dioxygenase-like cupin family protein
LEIGHSISEDTISTSFTLKKLNSVKDSGPEFGLTGVQEARFAKDDLEAVHTGIAYHRLSPGKRSPFGHRHEEAEEIYVIVNGSGRLKLNEDVIELEVLDAVRVAPNVVRAFEAGPRGIEILAVGPRHDGDGEIIPGWWDGQ